MSIFNLDPADGDINRREISLRPRLIAAAWFSVAAVVPVVFFLLTFGGVWTDGFAHINLWSLWFLCAIPISAAALCGFRNGYQIIDPLNKTTPWRAAVRGAVVAILSYVVFMSAYGVMVFVSFGARQGHSLAESADMVLTVFVIGLLMVGWLILIAGAAAGYLLFLASKRRGFYDYVVNAPRATVASANRWTVFAILLFLANLGALIFLKGSQL